MASLIKSIQDIGVEDEAQSQVEGGYKLSLTQRCELSERRVFKLLTPAEQLHLQASMGSSQVWVNVPRFLGRTSIFNQVSGWCVQEEDCC